MTDKMREEFEAAFAKKTASLGAGDPDVADLDDFGGFERVLLEAMTEDRNGDTYRNNVFASAWWAWQASRESLVIELPQQSGANRVWNQAIRYCHQAIEAVGLKVKP